ncbi:Hypothetical protein ETEE_2245 [Edwardsiella anguillarum ET080813]|uniref:Uncharacterized protein n=1 Tax=Edwardsiella anguillarum ET080813 TaxID=667120 RepID=A0A076LQ14_9GAMM|nr:Hypothetical protein ETEE_2245 [Edwardsiella anguillarum ET080813]
MIVVLGDESDDQDERRAVSCNGMVSRRRACGVHRRTAEIGQCNAVACARLRVSIDFGDSYDLYVM